MADPLAATGSPNAPAPNAPAANAPAAHVTERRQLVVRALEALERCVAQAPLASDRMDLLMDLESLLLEIEGLSGRVSPLPATRRAAMLALSEPPNRGAKEAVIVAYIHAVALGEPMPTLVAIAMASRHRELMWLIAASDPQRYERGLRPYAMALRTIDA